MDLSDLPLFTVSSVRCLPNEPEAIVVGCLSHLRGVHNSGGTLYRAAGRSIIGMTSTAPLRANEDFEFTTPDVDGIADVLPGQSFPWIDIYWQAYHVDLILYGDWFPRAFAPSPAEYFRIGKVSGWQPVGMPLPDGAVSLGVHDGAWDHEHCMICNVHIGAGGSDAAYSDADDHWLCTACHERYAVRKDMSFLG